MQNRINSITTIPRTYLGQNGVVFLIALLAVLLVYGQAWNAGLVSDWTGTAWRIEHSRGAVDILTNFGFPSNQQLLNLLLYLMYETLGNAPPGWYLVFCLIHACNGFLFFLLLKELAHTFSARPSPVLLGLATAIFLFHPNQNEAVVWKACLNWLTSSTCVLLGIWAFLRGARSRSRGHLWLGHLCFLAGLFLLEQVFVFPLYILLLGLGWWRAGLKPRAGYWLGRAGLPLALLMGSYLVLNQLTLGAWVGHYGAETHLKLDLSHIGANMLKYLSKILIWSRYTVADKGQHYAALEGEYVLGLAGITLAALAIAAWVYWKRMPGELKVAAILGGFGLIALLPVSNLYFYHLLYVENDRYAYLPSGFLTAAFLFLLALAPKWLSIPAATAFLLVSMHYLLFTLGLWKDNAKVLYALLDDYRWAQDQPVYVLNLPDNNMGVRLFRDYGDDSGLLDHLRYSGGLEISGQPKGILSYNMTDNSNGVEVVQTSDSTLTVKFRQWGNWWWHHGQGARDYETDAYEVRVDGQQYHLLLKDLPETTVLIYQDSLAWKAWPLTQPAK